MLNIAVIESDPTHASYLSFLFQQVGNAHTAFNISTYRDNADFSETIKKGGSCPFDLIFIDLNSSPVNGISVARNIRARGLRPVIVFTSTSADKAIEGYEVQAYRYFLKPLSLEKIRDCVSHALRQKSGNFFTCKYRGITNSIPYQDIVCFESIEHYVEIHTLHNTIRMKGSLSKIQDNCPFDFVRCHRSYLVNLAHIRMQHGRQITLTNGQNLDISPQYLKIFEKRFAQK